MRKMRKPTNISLALNIDRFAHFPEGISPLRIAVYLGRSYLDLAGVLERRLACGIADLNREVTGSSAGRDKASACTNGRAIGSASRSVGEGIRVTLDQLAILHGDTRLHLIGGGNRERNAADAGNNALDLFLARSARLVDVVRKVTARASAFVAAIGDDVRVISDSLTRQRRGVVAGLVAGDATVCAELQRRDDDVQRANTGALVLSGTSRRGEDRNSRNEVDDLRVHRRGDGGDLRSSLVDEVED